MEFQSSNSRQTVSAIFATRRHRDTLLFVAIFIGLLCLVPGLVFGGIAFGFALTLAVLGMLVLAGLIVRWPVLGFFVVLLCVLVIEQSPLPILNNGPLIYIFYWPARLQGLPDRPIGFFMLAGIVALSVANFMQRRKLLHGGELLFPFLLLFLFVIWGIVHGLTSGGKLQIVVEEVRSFWYLFLGYLLAYNFVRKKSHIYSIFWVVISCAAIKALEALYIFVFIVHGDLSANRFIMAHEDSYFWVSIILLIVLFSLHYKYKRQYYVALALLPILFIALLANNRRADYLALLVGIVIAWVLVFAVKPHMRKALIALFLVSVLLFGGYTAAFYNSQGGTGQVARSVVSLFHADAADAASNLYRDTEDFDLKYTVKLNPLGLGFGKQFLEPLALPNILAKDPVYLYIPHNTIFWVWMRLGPLGYLALWYFFGSIIVRGCIYVRNLRDKYLQLTAIFIVCMTVMEILVAFVDYQLSFYRCMIYTGVLAGVLMKLPSLDKELLDKQQDENEKPKNEKAKVEESDTLNLRKAKKSKREVVYLWEY